ncbi:hypothetical protein [Nevskia sp.]|uniref:hypothetical protein n=1 Tax=Nevskia sp. TaxID=1929292 RepID=UPI0025CDF040|nr:hypothetical protein [Nevskia sp.]
MKIVRSMAVVNPVAVGVVCDWCGEVSLRDPWPRRKKVAFRTMTLGGGDGSSISGDICSECADRPVERPRALLAKLVREARSARAKPYAVYRFAAFDIDTNRIVRVQSLLPFCEPTP